MQKELMLISEKDIRNKIYNIRGKEVMLDSDLAELYHCKNGTKTINQAVNRHRDRFPNDFYFELTEEETKNLWSQFGTANKMSRTLPNVFTEQGVAMLSSILRTEVASKVSINIMRAFVAMRHIIKNSIDYQKELFIMQNKVLEIDNKLTLHDSKFEDIFNRFDSEDYLKNKLVFKNHIYDAYSFLLDILNKSKKELIIIDNYCDKKILDLICNLKVNVIVISKNINNELINKYQSQYNNLTIKHDDSFHDRFIIIDKKIIYQLGSSLKDLGKKCSYISIFDNEVDIDNLINKGENICKKN